MSSRRPTATDIAHALMGGRQRPQAPGMANGGVFVEGGGTGRSDDVPASMDAFGDARLSRGEYVIPADVVSAMGEGSSEAGAEALDRLVEATRAKWQQRVQSFPDPGEG